ncbi:MAG: PBSX family phage terminase large subunit, partial [Oscillospiraceae bacterium]|nr:PBSX family phage terminase large subunit [Oscillospiraceae bacterium]
GWNTTPSTRPRIIANLHAVMRDTPEAVLSADTLREMLVFVRNKHMRPEAAPGEHDDLVMAAAICHGIRDQQSVEIVQEKPKPRKKLKEQLEKNNRTRRR